MRFGLGVVVAFLAGAIPFAVWLGRLAGVDPRQVGDGNPGATNAWKAGGWRLGLPVLLLDFAKAATPVAIARQLWAWDGPWLVAVALAPVLGHRFSPFLRGQGGKGVAAVFGVWTGLTLAEGPLVMGIVMAMALLGLRWRDGWAVLAGQAALLVDLMWRGHPLEMWPIWLALTGLLAWSYRDDLGQSPRRPIRAAAQKSPHSRG
ncbi:MAG: hypothetical protein D6790_05365 [Caldilineae bacterium]|nr:MAG: hypothetical protein D6790_05365 [Caldilineae bacterium]